MPAKTLLALASVGLAGLVGLLMSAAAQAQNGTALTGKVTSAQEPVMEGVLVSARRDGANITTTCGDQRTGRL